MGNGANASEKTLAVGFGATSIAADSQAFGNGAFAAGPGDISIGKSAGVGSDVKRANVDGGLIAIGVEAGQNVIGSNNVALGSKAGSNVHSNFNVAIGTEAGGAGSIAIGTEGFDPNVPDDSASSHMTMAQGERSVAVGSGANAETDHSVAIGTRATVHKQVNETTPQANNSIAIGYFSNTTGTSAVATGDNATAAGNHSIAMGHNAFTGEGAVNSIAIGTGTKVTSPDSAVVGPDNRISGAKNHAFGTGNEMKNSGTGTAVPIDGAAFFGNSNVIEVINNNQDQHVGHVNDAHVMGSENKILQKNEGFMIDQVQISGSGNTVQGEAAVNAEAGSLTGVTISGFGNTVTGRNLDDFANKTENITIVGNGNTVDATKVDRKDNIGDIQILGSGVDATVGNSAYIGTGSSAKKMADGTTAGVGQYEEKYYTDKGGNVVAFAGSEASGVVTVGAEGNYRRVQNVAAGLVGKDSTDAVNGSQLYYATRDHHYLGDNSNLAEKQNVIDVGSDGFLNIKGGTRIDDGNTLETQLTDGNIGVVADGENHAMTVKLNKDVVLGDDTKDGSLTLKNNNGTESVKMTATKSSRSLDGTSTIDRAALSGKKEAALRRTADDASSSTHAIATMDDGLAFAGDDASKVNRLLNTILTLKGGAAGEVTENNIAVKSFTDNDVQGFNIQLAKDITGLNSVTTKNLTVESGGTFNVENNTDIDMGGNQIHNVAPGTALTDAVNVSQLRGMNMDVKQEFGRVDGRISQLGNQLRHAGANAAALAALHPTDFNPDDKWDFAGGYGNYRGANAVAFGAFYRPTEDIMLNVGASMGGGENMVNAGVTFKLGQSNGISHSRVAMAKEIRDMRKLLAEQQAEIAELKSMHGLKVDPAKSELFPDVAENHWAYEYVTKLAKEGVLEGDPDGLFHGDRMMSRYEFAAIVYRLVQSGRASTDPELSRLVKDFSPELRYIRIDVIEKDKTGKPTIERVKVV